MTSPVARSAESVAARSPDSSRTDGAIARHHLEFEGSGREYFKVWLVNVVLTVLTLGFYTPFARRRTASYFYNHTVVADSPLEFTGSIKRMLVGFLVVTTAYAMYELAGWLEYEWAVNIMLILAAVAAPFLWGSAMRFRTRSTRWRGIRPLFVASWKEIYRQSWPIFAIALVWIAVVVAFNYTEISKDLEVAQAMEQLEVERDEAQSQLGDLDEENADAEPAAPDADPEAAKAAPNTAAHGTAAIDPKEAKLSAEYEAAVEKLSQPPYDQFDDSSSAYFTALKSHWVILAALALVGLLATLPLVVLLEFNYRRLFVQRTQIGSLSGHWKPMYSDFFRVWLATIGVSLLIAVVTFGLLSALLMGLMTTLGRGNLLGIVWLSLIIGLMALLTLAAVLSPIMAYKEARMFQLLWNNIGIGAVARFKCNLRTWGFVRLRIWNLFLTAVTLGFYRPFARAAEYRMKLESVTLYVKGNLDDLEGRVSQEQGALGDAFADMMGMDLIT